MERLKRIWDQQFPEKNKVSKQILRFRREMKNYGRKGTNKDNEDNDKISGGGNIEWATEMK